MDEAVSKMKVVRLQLPANATALLENLDINLQAEYSYASFVADYCPPEYIGNWTNDISNRAANSKVLYVKDLQSLLQADL